MSLMNDDRLYAFYDLNDTIQDLRKDLKAYGNIEFAAICSEREIDGSKEILGYMLTEDMHEIELLDDDFYEVMHGNSLLSLLEQQQKDAH